MKLITSFLLLASLAIGSLSASASDQVRQNRYPLVQKPYMELPLGSIHPAGWLYSMLDSQRCGMTAAMDELYPQVMGESNGWLGGDGDRWERGPYWVDGMLPLAYIMNDSTLITKVQPWIEWALSSQKEDGFFGPETDSPNLPGIQRDNAKDWWPRMVVLKILKQHYSATGDSRVIPFMTNYFRYQLESLSQTPLDNWTFWSLFRASDNMQAIYWLYNITGDSFLLDLADLIHTQMYDFDKAFSEGDVLSNMNTIHCVNLAQGIKSPAVWYQQTADPALLKNLKKGFADLKKYNGWPTGMYGADEDLHGKNPTQGTELCSIVEMMLSLEEIFQITGDAFYAEYLERVAFNALPTQISDDFMKRQYFQQANQVVCKRDKHNFSTDHEDTDNVFGLLTGYPCCTSNLHQGWPKFTQNLWYATPDKGLAAMIYSPSVVIAKVSDDRQVTIKEETAYPFEEEIRFVVSFEGSSRVRFPLHLRMPSWCEAPVVMVNGKEYQVQIRGDIAVINREWRSGDCVSLTLPMHLSSQKWYQNSVSIERGPLIYALRIEEKWKKTAFKGQERVKFGDAYYEVYPQSAWNYGLLEFDPQAMEEAFKVEIDNEKLSTNYPWNLEENPVQIKAQAMQIPYWTIYNGSAGPLPWSPVQKYKCTNQAEVILVPYGCTTLRISEFPVISEVYY